MFIFCLCLCVKLFPSERLQSGKFPMIHYDMMYMPADGNSPDSLIENVIKQTTLTPL